MTVQTIKQSVIFPCTPQELYEAWMDSTKHGAMVEGNAKIDAKVGGVFSIWDGAIVGTNLELDPTRHRIVQSWRYEYEDWPKNKPSTLTIELKKHKDGCELHLTQTDIPQKYAKEIEQGWKDFYWEPMKKYFG